MRTTVIIILVFFCFQHKINPQSYKKKDSTFAENNLILVDAGKFKMGSKNGEVDEKPVRRKEIHAFYIGKYEVSYLEFAEFLNSMGNQNEKNSIWIDLNGKWEHLKCRIYEKEKKFFVENGFEDFPVNFVSWYGANAYCKWRGGRLPTEAEWEYVAKGGKHGKKKLIKEIENNLGHYAWYFDNSGQNLHKKGQKKSNILGIFDLNGNVWEWCSDFYDSKYYSKSSKIDPTGSETGDFKVIRGGSWTNKPEMLRVSNRNAVNPTSNKIALGFRIVYDIP